MFVDPVLKDSREMLVTRIVKCEPLAQRIKRTVATGLGPAVRIHIGMQTTVRITMNMCATSKDCR